MSRLHQVVFDWLDTVLTNAERGIVHIVIEVLSYWVSCGVGLTADVAATLRACDPKVAVVVIDADLNRRR